MAGILLRARKDLTYTFSTLLFQTEARHLNGLKVASSSKNMEHSFTGLVPRGIRQSGPSQGGPGHRSGNAQLLGSPQHSGPSPGVGHKYSAGMHYQQQCCF
ncbi:hypothetical protein SADUNF_Sadunf16G0181300 [Salix dunnii]|uniref:Uncharacterized protein n=1 Tax=Salix dunnii TaxID=1413687 RepID=A0A835JCC4_9ROSI|nr:hypothetical protein SADUNF_Sadunf16G0181300 [Salix dunnii]